MRIFLATHPQLYFEMRGYKTLIESKGHTVANRNLTAPAVPTTLTAQQEEIVRMQIANTEVQDVADADMCVYFAANGWFMGSPPCGSFALGMAYALGKELVIIGKREEPAHYLLRVSTYENLLEFLSDLPEPEPRAFTNMWTASLQDPEVGYQCQLECEADTLVEAAYKLSRDLSEGDYLSDLSCRGTVKR